MLFLVISSRDYITPKPRLSNLFHTIHVHHISHTSNQTKIKHLCKFYIYQCFTGCGPFFFWGWGKWYRRFLTVFNRWPFKNSSPRLHSIQTLGSILFEGNLHDFGSTHRAERSTIFVMAVWRRGSDPCGTSLRTRGSGGVKGWVQGVRSQQKRLGVLQVKSPTIKIMQVKFWMIRIPYFKH